MTPSSDLHILIHSLTQAEKRYVKVFARRHAANPENNSLLLFEAIQTQTQYDEAALKQQFSYHQIGRQFASSKNRLFDLVLKAMRAFHDEKSIISQVRNLIKDAAFLRDRRLYPLANKRRNKAFRIAKKHQFHPEILEILAQEIREIKGRKLKDMAEQLTQCLQETDSVLQLMVTEHKLYSLNQKLFVTTRKEFTSRNPDLNARIMALQQEPIMQEVPPNPSHRSHAWFHENHGLLEQLLGNWDNSYQHKKKIVELWEANPHLIRQASYAYYISLANLLAGCHMSGRYAEMPGLIAKIKMAKPENEDDMGELFSNRAFYQLLYSFNTGDFEAALEGIDEIEEGLLKYDSKINKARKLSFWYNISLLNFLNERFRESLRWTNMIIHDERSEHRKDLQQSARILLLILHYELGNEDLLEYLFRSVHRFLYLSKNNSEFEQAVLNFLQKSTRTSPGKKREASFADLHQTLKKIEANPQEGNAPGMTEVSLWLESKVSKRPLREVAREFARKKSPR